MAGFKVSFEHNEKIFEIGNIIKITLEGYSKIYEGKLVAILLKEISYPDDYFRSEQYQHQNYIVIDCSEKFESDIRTVSFTDVMFVEIIKK